MTTVTSVPRFGKAEHMLLERPGDVAVPALDHVEGHRHVKVHPSIRQHRRTLRIHGGVHGPHLGRAERQRISDRAQGCTIELVDEDDQDVGATGCEPHDRFALRIVLERVDAIGVVPHKGDAHMIVGKARPGQARAGPRFRQAFAPRDVVLHRHEQVHVSVLRQTADEPRQPACLLAAAAEDLQRDLAQPGRLPRRLDLEGFERILLDVNRGEVVGSDRLRVPERVDRLRVDVVDEQDRDGTLEPLDVHPLEVLLEVLVLAFVLVVQPDEQPDHHRNEHHDGPCAVRELRDRR